MKVSAGLFLFVFFLAACSPSGKEGREDETADALGKKNEAVIDRYRMAIENKNFEVMEALLADDFIGYGPGAKGFTTKSREIQNWKRYWRVYDSFRFERVAYTTESKAQGLDQGDWVFVWGHFTYREKKKTPPMTYGYAYHSSYKVEGGKIKMRASNLNVSDVISQTGYKFVPPVSRRPLNQ